MITQTAIDSAVGYNLTADKTSEDVSVTQ